MDNDFRIGSKGGHGPIKYSVNDYTPKSSVTFQFTLKGFEGIHKFEISEKDLNKSLVSHTIDMKTSGLTTFKWIIVIRWLHDAFIEDAFDKSENYFEKENRPTHWSLWVFF